MYHILIIDKNNNIIIIHMGCFQVDKLNILEYLNNTLLHNINN